MSGRYLAALVVLCFASACAHQPRPAVTAGLEGVRSSATARAASTLAPQAYARAESLRQRARDAESRGEIAAATILAEHASAAYEHAFVVARIARSTAVAEAATAGERASRLELGSLDAELQRVIAEADDVEVRAKAVRDAVVVLPSPRVQGAREEARLTSARAVSEEARLLCVAAQLVGVHAPGLVEAQQGLAALQQKLRASPHPAPMEESYRIRALCLAALTQARRPARAASVEGKADVLLTELAAGGDFRPSRDDRGVTLRIVDAFDAKGLAKDAEEQLTALGRVAAAHPAFPVHVRMYPAQAADSSALQEPILRAIVQPGVVPERVVVELAPPLRSVPIPGTVSSKGRAANKGHGALEVVFIDPGG